MKIIKTAEDVRWESIKNLFDEKKVKVSEVDKCIEILSGFVKGVIADPKLYNSVFPIFLRCYLNRISEER